MKNEKTFNRKIFLIVFLIIFLSITLILLLSTVRKFLIIKNLENNFLNYSNIQNYHIEITETSSVFHADDRKTTIDYYRKGDRIVHIYKESNSSGDLLFSRTTYNFKELSNEYTIDSTTGEKVARMGCEYVPLFNIKGICIEPDINIFKILNECFWTRIESVKYDGKECYKLSGAGTVIVEKDTGIIIQTDRSKLKYEFNNVDDSVFIEPDIDEQTTIIKIS